MIKLRVPNAWFEFDENDDVLESPNDYLQRISLSYNIKLRFLSLSPSSFCSIPCSHLILRFFVIIKH